VPGLGASFGRGAATGFQQDLANSDCILIMGSNMAEAHPVGFRWPMKARERGATIIHVDPRFSRTSACANMYTQIRAGTDIAFLGGLINYVLTHDKWFKEFVLAYTNASTIIDPEFQDTEDLGGIFSGYDKKDRAYESGRGRWAYEGSPAAKKHAGEFRGDQQPEAQGPGGMGPQGAGDRKAGEGTEHGIHGPALMGGASTHSSKRSGSTMANPRRDPTLKDPNCAMNLLRKHYARYTPELVSQICGCKPEEVERIAELMCQNSGPDRTSAIVYAVGWTQHSIGPQIIRAAGILQQLLGNIGRPGGMIMAMRGHCSIQGSTDIPTLYDLLPGYLPQPTVEKDHETLDGYVEFESFPTGYWSKMKPMMVSLLKAYYGSAATRENDYRFKWLPHIDGDYSQLPFFREMTEGKVKGYFVFGQNPAAGAPNAGLHRKGLRELEWLVVADWFETETAVFWKNDPKGPKPGDIKTEVFLIPAASIAAKEGTFTNTQRLLQWHNKAVDPEGDCRSDLAFIWNLGRRLKQLYAGSTKPQDQAIQALTWDYAYDKPPLLPDGRASRLADEPDAEKVLQEINGYFTSEKDEKNGKPKLLPGFAALKDDGSTACGCWIYSGVFPSYDRNRANERKLGNNPLQPDWAFAWPHNRRTLYNRCSADPSGKPWSNRKALIWWDAGKKKWVGFDEPDFEPDKSPDYRPSKHATGMQAIAGDQPFIMKPDGVAWLFSPALKDGPFPTHYEPAESPIGNLLYPRQNDSPTIRYFEGPLNLIDHVPSQQFPIVACTFRLTEHYLSGPMSRFNSWLNELQPAMFVEISPELAAEKGIENGGWCTVKSARGAIETRALVTRRLRPLQIGSQRVHQIGIPFHWGFAGEVVGDVANDLVALTAEPNVSIQEDKAFTVDVFAGRTYTSNQTPTQSYARWPTTAPAPHTPKSAQPEGQIHNGGGTQQ
jgi:formate dehydrogenase major subunit